jgi:hypothetical protein
MMDVKEDPVRRLRRLVCSRKKWKRRIAEKQNLIRFLRVKTRDLETSRSSWKERAISAEAAIRHVVAGSDPALSTSLEFRAVTATCAKGEK